MCSNETLQDQCTNAILNSIEEDNKICDSIIGFAKSYIDYINADLECTRKLTEDTK